MNIKNWHSSTLAGQTVKNLRDNHFTAEYFADRDEAVKYILSLIDTTDSVGTGGSMTLTELGIHEMLVKRGNTLLDHSTAKTNEESMEICRNQLTSDVFLSSANAISLDGKIVNIDGRCNRVAALSFGPKRVIVVAGINKIAADLNAAIYRARNIAAPMNAKRLNKKTPCAVTGTCSDCKSPERICRAFQVLHQRPYAIDYHIVLIGEHLGY
ncbi:MAG: lactate utilization protein [Negativicutes bacterium]|jgi:L-lactate utilization protein LutB